MDSQADVTLRAITTQPLGEAAPGWTPEAAPGARLSWRLPSVEAGEPVEDAQVYAAAELVRLGYASRVTIVNGAVDDALPDAWEILGTPVRLERRSGDRATLTAGPR